MMILHITLTANDCVKRQTGFIPNDKSFRMEYLLLYLAKKELKKYCEITLLILQAT